MTSYDERDRALVAGLKRLFHDLEPTPTQGCDFATWVSTGGRRDGDQIRALRERRALERLLTPTPPTPSPDALRRARLGG